MTLRIRAWCRRLCPQAETKKRKDGKEAANPSADALYNALMGKGTHAQLDKARHPTAPFFEIRAHLAAKLKEEEKLLKSLAAQLPGARFVHETKGISLLSLAALVGECPGKGRSFLDYATYHRVWKRLGLGVMPDGQRQRRVKGEEAIEHGYSPVRRSMVWVIGESAMKQGPYAARYQAIKAREKAKWEAQGFVVMPAKDLPTERGPQHKTAGDLHKRAKCLMEKELVRDLWRAFRREARARFPEEMPIQHPCRLTLRGEQFFLNGKPATDCAAADVRAAAAAHRRHCEATAAGRPCVIVTVYEELLQERIASRFPETGGRNGATMRGGGAEDGRRTTDPFL